MSYCTLEEAWGEEFDNETKIRKRKNKKDTKNIYNKYGNNIYTESQKKII